MNSTWTYKIDAWGPPPVTFKEPESDVDKVMNFVTGTNTNPMTLSQVRELTFRLLEYGETLS